MIESGEEARVNFDVGTGECQYDLRVELDDGEVRVRRNANVCAITQWTIED